MEDPRGTSTADGQNQSSDHALELAPRTRVRLWPYVLCLLLLSIPAIQPLLSGELTWGYDNAFHLWRAVQIEHLLRQGILFSRWAPDMAHGFGFPLFVFVSPLSAYVPAILHMAGLPWPVALNAAFVVGMLLGGLFAFLLARDLFGPLAGLVAAAGYLYAPFQAYEAFYRGSLWEAFAWAFPPLVLWGVHRWITQRDRRFLLVGAVGLAALILTHQLFAFLFIPLLVAWVAMAAALARDWRVLGRGVLVGLLGLGLSAFFWLPGLAERGYVQTDRLLGTWVFDYRYNFLSLSELLALPRPADPTLINDWPPKALGLIPALVALLPLTRWRKLLRATRWQVGVLLGVMAACAFMTLSPSLALWDHLPLLEYAQFPWRYLAPAALCAALLAGSAVAELRHASASRSHREMAAAAALIVTLTLTALGWFYPRHSPAPPDTSIPGMLAWERETDTLGTTAKGEYLPTWVRSFPDESALEAAYAGGGAIVRLPGDALPDGTQILQADYGPLEASVDLESAMPFRARYLAFYYPGWRVRVDGKQVPVTPTEPENLVSFEVPAGRHRVEVTFEETPLRLMADVASVLSVAVLVFLAVRLPGRSRGGVASALRAQGSPWPVLVVLVVLVATKLALVDRAETPLRRANLVDRELRRVSVPAEVVFGDEFVLLGSDGLPTTVPSGYRVELKTYWHALQPGGPDYGVTVHIVDAEGQRWDDVDIRPPRWHRTPPVVGEWPTDQYALIALSVPLRPGTPPGTYTVELVAFDRSTRTPLTAHDPQGAALGPTLELGEITVTRPRHPADPQALGLDRSLERRLGPLTLLDAHTDRSEARPGDSVLVTTYWRAAEQPSEELAMRVALLRADGSRAAEYDLAPAVAWYPTSAWKQGDVWLGQHALRLPAGLESGAFSWAMGLCRSKEGECQPLGSDTTVGGLVVSAPERLWTAPALDVVTDVRLGNVVTLLGAILQPEGGQVKLGRSITVTLVWRAEAEMAQSYSVFLHLIGPDGTLVSQSDGEPANWTRPTTGWLAGEVVLDERVLTMPETGLPGGYQVQAGMYVPQRGRLAAPDGRDALTVVTYTMD